MSYLLQENFTAAIDPARYIVVTEKPGSVAVASGVGLDVRLSTAQPAGRDGKVRSELRLRLPGRVADVYDVDPAGSDRWDAVDFLIKSDWIRDTNKVLLMQSHHVGAGPASGSAPPIQIFLWNSTIYFRVTNDLGRSDPYKKTFAFGMRHRLIRHVKWGKTGYVDAWLDGVPMFARYRTTGGIGYSSSPTNWSSVGLYAPAAPFGYAAPVLHECSYGRWWRGDESCSLVDFTK